MNRWFVRSFFAPTIWLSDQLRFQRKYLLIGLVVLLALISLSLPLLQQAQEQSQFTYDKLDGLKLFVSQIETLIAFINARSYALENHAYTLPKQLIISAHLLDWSRITTSIAKQARRLQESLGQIRTLETGNVEPQARFAAYTSAINALIDLISSSANAHRLNIDPELDNILNLLINSLPLVLNTLGKQQDALTLNSDEMTSYALSTQVVLTDSSFSLKSGIEQLITLKPSAKWLSRNIEILLSGIIKQQDTVDMTLSDPGKMGELRALVTRNQQLGLALLSGIVATVNTYLNSRIHSLRNSQWLIAGLLLCVISAIAYLFAGIYLSTLRSLKTLSEGTEAFCKGDLGARIKIDTKDELVLIARNFNIVANKVEQLLVVVREQNDLRERELESQVWARTIELADKNAQLLAAGLRVQEELQLARNMQLAILPQTFPYGLGWSIYARMLPARELSGDFYDCFRLSKGRYGILVADVSGKGVGAAFFMAVSRTILLNLATTNLGPAEVLARSNDLLCEHNPMELFVTACYGIFDPFDGSFTYATAGHAPPLLRLASSEVLPLACSYNIAMGVMPTMHYVEHITIIERGSTLLLYTDGVTEAFAANGEAYGEKRLRAWLANITAPNASTIVEQLMLSVETFITGAEASDNLTCLVLHYNPPADDKRQVLLIDKLRHVAKSLVAP